VKVVINACFGGFSLSPRAIKAYADRKGWPCFFFDNQIKGDIIRLSDEDAFAQNKLFGPSAYKVATVKELPARQDNWHELTLAERKASNQAWADVSISDREIARDDPDLVAVVEALGTMANGRCARLNVVEIPNDVQWEIEEYDGNEHIAESHRTWS
jgi:hypothetical protein